MVGNLLSLFVALLVKRVTCVSNGWRLVDIPTSNYLAPYAVASSVRNTENTVYKLCINLEMVINFAFIYLFVFENDKESCCVRAFDM